MIRILAIIIAGIFILLASPVAHADKKADSVLRQTAAATKAARTLTYDYRMSITAVGHTECIVGMVKCMRPNYIRADSWWVDKASQVTAQPMDLLHEIWASDGKTLSHINQDGIYSKTRANAGRLNFETADDGADAAGFFSPAGFVKKHDTLEYKYIGAEVWDGIRCDVLTLTTLEHGRKTPLGKIYIGSDQVLRRYVYGHAPEFLIEMAIHHLKIGDQLVNSQFAFKKPAFADAVLTEASSKPYTKPEGGPYFDIDMKSNELFQKVARTLKATQTIIADYTSVNRSVVTKAVDGKRHARTRRDAGTLMAMKPNYVRMEDWREAISNNTGLPEKIGYHFRVSDGQTYWNLWDVKHNHFESEPADAHGHNIRVNTAMLSDFFDPVPAYSANRTGGWDRTTIRYLGVETWHGEPYDIVQKISFMRGREDEPSDTEIKMMFIGRDGLFHRIMRHTRFGNGDILNYDDTITHLQTGVPLTKADFTFSVPSGAVEKKEFSW